MVKNYTSSIPASRSVQHIEDKLVANGAKNILKLYDNKKLSGIAFIMTVNGSDVPFRMPARIGNLEKIFRAQVRRPQPGTYERITAQAERTAWKLLADWVDIQCSLIELQQVQFMEVFLPYIYDHSKEETYFETIKRNGFDKLLLNDKRQK